MGDPKELWSGGLSVNPLTPDINSQELGKRKEKKKKQEKWPTAEGAQSVEGSREFSDRVIFDSQTSVIHCFGHSLEPDTCMSLVAAPLSRGFALCSCLSAWVWIFQCYYSSFEWTTASASRPQTEARLRGESHHRRNVGWQRGWTRAVHLSSVEDSSGFCASAITTNPNSAWGGDENIFVWHGETATHSHTYCQQRD